MKLHVIVWNYILYESPIFNYTTDTGNTTNHLTNNFGESWDCGIKEICPNNFGYDLCNNYTWFEEYEGRETMGPVKQVLGMLK